MTRPLRLEFAGALYHVTSRGDHCEAIYRDDSDRRAWLETLELVCGRFNFVIYAYCQMTNHYHVLIETVEGNLSQGMRQLNGLYTQHFNRRHGLVGHLFQGRYKAILVQKESHLLELSRYVVLNPLRARLVHSLLEWPWSSHPFLVGARKAPAWLDSGWLLSQFGSTRGEAIQRYMQFVMDGIGRDSPLKQVSYQLILGDAAFTSRYHHDSVQDSLRDVGKAQRRAVGWPLDEYQRQFPDRDEAIFRAYFSTMYTMRQIAEFFGISLRTVNRAVRKFEAK
ncbi:transposase [Rugamonas apoptosis]|uniref:Transposase n=1 Tax=Rugamonas apoptosis TaxID=2758570 RepID=A0A7W2FAA0_9BURK|nr:transposase [Rugamonas apoptosis]MBA5687995.1 transposase [Rugamonas apoptosis]